MSSQPGTTTILEILESQFPQHRIRSNGRNFRTTCPICPSRSGNTLTIASHGNWHKCFSGTPHEGNTKAFMAVLQGTTPDQIVQVRVASEQRRKEGWVAPEGANIATLCPARGSNEEWVRDKLGWVDTTHWGVDAIRMPVLDVDGSFLANRYRISINERRKVVSEAGSHVYPYGLWLLDRESPEVTIVEGETDTSAMTYNEFQTLGLPGVNTWQPEWRRYLNGIPKVYIWEESGVKSPTTGLTPGETMVRSCSRSLGQVFVIKAPPEAKDPAELAVLYGDKFPERMRELMNSALPEDHSLPVADTMPPILDHFEQDSPDPWSTLPFSHKHTGEGREKPIHLERKMDYRFQETLFEQHLERGDDDLAPYRESRRHGKNTLNIILPNHRRWLDHRTLVALLGSPELARANEKIFFKKQKVDDCSKLKMQVCVEHGVRGTYPNHCKQSLHTDSYCFNSVASEIAHMEALPNLFNESANEFYQAFHLLLPVNYGGSTLEERTGSLREFLDNLKLTLKRMRSRKAFKNMLITWSTGWELDDNDQVICRLMLNLKGDSQFRSTWMFIRTLSSELAPFDTVAGPTTKDGEAIVRQAMADANHHLLGVSEPLSRNGQDFFNAYVCAFNEGRKGSGTRQFESYGEFKTNHRSRGKPELPLCEICDRQLESMWASASVVNAYLQGGDDEVRRRFGQKDWAVLVNKAPG